MATGSITINCMFSFYNMSNNKEYEFQIYMPVIQFSSNTVKSLMIPKKKTQIFFMSRLTIILKVISTLLLFFLVFFIRLRKIEILHIQHAVFALKKFESLGSTHTFSFYKWCHPLLFIWKAYMNRVNCGNCFDFDEPIYISRTLEAIGLLAFQMYMYFKYRCTRVYVYVYLVNTLNCSDRSNFFSSLIP